MTSSETRFLARTGFLGSAMDVVGIGFAVWDHLGVIDQMPEFDGPNVPLIDFASSGGGPASTALIALARLGVRTGFLGVVGDDEYGDRTLKALQQEGVDVSRLRVQAGARSAPCIVLVHARTGQRSILPFRGTFDQLVLKPADRPYITSARILHLDGQHMAAAITAAQWMRQAGGTVVYDANKPRPRLEQLLPWVDVLITDAAFPQAYTGLHIMEEAARRLLQAGPRVVVVTLGRDGCVCYDGKSVQDVPGFQVEVVDTTGAGDAFHGGYIYGMLQGWDMRRSATFANAVAALNCRALGGRAGLPPLPEVEALLSREKLAG